MLRYPVVTLQQIHIIKLSIILSADDLQSLNSTVVLHHHKVLQWKRQQIHRRFRQLQIDNRYLVDLLYRYNSFSVRYIKPHFYYTPEFEGLVHTYEPS